MGGLEKILKEISASAEAEAEEILTIANREAAEIKIQCEKDKLSLAESLKKETQDACMRLSSASEATAASEARRIILAAKTNAINKTIEYLKEEIKNSEDYFDILLTLIKNNSEAKDGIIYFNQKDLKRLPEGYAEKIQSVAKGNIAVSPSTVDLDAGFIIKYDKIEINCSINSLFEEKKNSLFDIINKSFMG